MHPPRVSLQIMLPSECLNLEVSWQLLRQLEVPMEVIPLVEPKMWAQLQDLVKRSQVLQSMPPLLKYKPRQSRKVVEISQPLSTMGLVVLHFYLRKKLEQ